MDGKVTGKDQQIGQRGVQVCNGHIELFNPLGGLFQCLVGGWLRFVQRVSQQVTLKTQEANFLEDLM